MNQDNQPIQFRGADASGDSTFMPGGYSLTLTQPILHYDDIFCGDQTDKRIVQAEADFPAALIAITPAPAKIIYWTTCV